MPRASVDSQIGPSTRVGATPRCGGPAWPAGRRSAAQRSAHDRMSGPVQRRADELRHPRIEDDLGPATLADVEHARDEPAGPGDERPPGLDGEARRPAVGRDGVEERGQLAREPLGRRRRLADGSRPGTRRRRRACRTSRSSPARGRPPPGPRRTASRQASTAPSCDPTWRWIPRGRSGPSGPPPASIASAISVSVIPNLDGAGTDRQPGQRLGRDVGVEPVEDVEPEAHHRPGARARPAPPASSRRLQRDPAQAGPRPRPRGPRRAGRPGSCRSPRA